MGKFTELTRKLSKEKRREREERGTAREMANKIDLEIEKEKRIREEKAYEEMIKEIADKENSLNSIMRKRKVGVVESTGKEISDKEKRMRSNVLKQTILDLTPIAYPDITKKLGIDINTCYYIVSIMLKEGLITKSWFSGTILVESTGKDIGILQTSRDKELSADKEFERENNRIGRFIRKHNSDDPNSLFNNTKLVKKILMGCPLSEEEK
jgi:hypothetical protein